MIQAEDRGAFTTEEAEKIAGELWRRSQEITGVGIYAEDEQLCEAAAALRALAAERDALLRVGISERCEYVVQARFPRFTYDDWLDWTSSPDLAECRATERAVARDMPNAEVRVVRRVTIDERCCEEAPIGENQP